MSSGTPEQDTRGFEQIMAEVDKLTALLERGEVPLEQALAAFERGMALVREAGVVLEQAEGRLARIVEGPRGEVREVAMPIATQAATNGAAQGASGGERERRDDPRAR